MKQKEKTMNKIVSRFMIILLAGFVWVGLAQAAEEPLQLKLAAGHVDISTFYNGTTLEVSGSLPADAEVVLQVSGPKKEVHLKEKGKVAGFLWMNKNDVTLENTPSVYMVYTPAGPVDNYLRPDLGVGYQALVQDIAINPESADKKFIFAEYVKLMEESGVYAIHEGSVKYGKSENGIKTFTVSLIVPSKMSAGAYQVEALAVKDGAAVGRVSEELTLKLTGLPAVIASMAFDKPLLFGIMAVVIAIATGLLIGVLFKGGGGAH